MPLNLAEHLMTCLAEECAEVGQMACKMLRFVDIESGRIVISLDDPANQAPATVRLVMELDDLRAIVELLQENGILKREITQERRDAITAKKTRVMGYWKRIEDQRNSPQ